MRISDWSSDVCSSDLLVYGRILDRGIGEDDSVGIDPLALVHRQVRGEVAVTVAVALVEEAARAVLGGRRRAGPGAREGAQAKGRSDEGRVGNKRVSPGRARWWPCHRKKQTTTDEIDKQQT